MPTITEPTPVLYFGNDWLAENRTSSHHLARCLAQHLPLLYVDSSTRAPRATGRDLRKIGRLLQKIRGSIAATTEVA